MADKTEEFIPTRRSLLSRLKNWEDQESWRAFFDTYWKLIYSVAMKAGCNDAEAQDVVQETLLSVAKEMPGFKYNPSLGSFKGWLLQITRRRMADHWRKQMKAVTTGQGEMNMLENFPDPEGRSLDKIWEQEWQQNLLQTALEKVKRQVHPKQYQMFDLYVTQQWPMEQVTGTLGVNAAQVYMAKYRVGGLLKKELRGLEKNPL